jgi:hypothetical protein
MPAKDKTQDLITSLPMKNLTKYAGKLNLKGYSKLKRTALLQLILDNWDGSLDSSLQEDLLAQEEIKLKAQGSRTARTRITEQLKKWVSETLDQDVSLGFPVITGTRVGSDMEVNSIHGTVAGKIKVSFASKTKVVGKVVSIDQQHQKLPSVGETLTFEYTKAIPASTVRGTKPTFYCEQYSAHIVTPYDQDRVYVGDVYFGESLL